METRRPLGVRRPPPNGVHGHQPAGPGQAQCCVGVRVLRRHVRTAIGGADALAPRRDRAGFCDVGDSRWVAPTSSTSRGGLGHSDATIDALPLDATGHVPHWPAGHNEVTLHRVLAHFAVETQRHAGHADIIRELIDGAVGLLPAYQGVQTHDSAWWQDHRDRLQGVAEAANRE